MHDIHVVAVQTQKPSKFAKVTGFVKQKTYQLAAVGTMAVMGVNANAAIGDGATSAPDMTPIISMINGLVAVVGSVGMAVLSVYATAKVFKWVKTAF